MFQVITATSTAATTLEPKDYEAEIDIFVSVRACAWFADTEAQTGRVGCF
jgi:hypothetical protein